MDEFDIVLCQWKDSFGATAHWRDIELEQEDLEANCESIGYLIKETKNYYIIAPHFAKVQGEEGSTVCGTMNVLKNQVTRLIKLNPGKNLKGRK